MTRLAHFCLLFHRHWLKSTQLILGSLNDVFNLIFYTGSEKPWWFPILTYLPAHTCTHCWQYYGLEHKLWGISGDWRRYTCAGFRTRFQHRGRLIWRQIYHTSYNSCQIIGHEMPNGSSDSCFWYINSWFGVVSVKGLLLLIPLIWKCTSV